ncbi:hypothetical protein [Limosilactobacillus fermentum]
MSREALNTGAKFTRVSSLNQPPVVLPGTNLTVIPACFWPRSKLASAS